MNTTFYHSKFKRQVSYRHAIKLDGYKLEKIIDKTIDSILILEFRNKNDVIQEKLVKNINYEKFI